MIKYTHHLFSKFLFNFLHQPTHYHQLFQIQVFDLKPSAHIFQHLKNERKLF